MSDSSLSASGASLDDLKREAALAAVGLVEDGMVVGLGTGSTAAFAVAGLGERVRAGLKILGIPTSERTAAQAQAEGIPLTTFAVHARIDITIDGADEVLPGSLHVIKGLGAALLREKIVAEASARLVIVADHTKLVTRLGEKAAVPVEVIPFGWEVTLLRLAELGCAPVLRRDDNGHPILTDGHHHLVDCRFPAIADPAALQARFRSIAGVVDTGLFIHTAERAYIAAPGGVRVLVRD